MCNSPAGHVLLFIFLIVLIISGITMVHYEMNNVSIRPRDIQLSLKQHRLHLFDPIFTVFESKLSLLLIFHSQVN